MLYSIPKLQWHYTTFFELPTPLCTVHLALLIARMEIETLLVVVGGNRSRTKVVGLHLSGQLVVISTQGWLLMYEMHIATISTVHLVRLAGNITILYETYRLIMNYLLGWWCYYFVSVTVCGYFVTINFVT